MAQPYKVLDVKLSDQWENKYGKFQSMALALEGVAEPVKLNKKVKEDGTFYTPKQGEELYGELQKKTATTGREYYQFKSQKPNFQGGQSSKRTYGKSKDELDGMAWGNALTNATQLVINHGEAKDLQQAISQVVATAELLVAGRTKSEPQKDKEMETAKEVESEMPDHDVVDLDGIPF